MATLQDLIVDDTGFFQFPSGTTAQRPTGTAGYMRYNSTISQLEFWDSNSSTWKQFANRPDGGTQATAFADLDELIGQYTTTQNLYHTWHGNYTTAQSEQVRVNFSNPSIPRYETTYNTTASNGSDPDTGGRCVSLAGSINSCSEGTGQGYNLYAAARACQRAGMRLCTQTEIENAVAEGSGCGHDANAIWTSTTRGDGRFILCQGNDGFITTARYPTEDNTNLSGFSDNRVAIRCCTPFTGSDLWDLRG